MAETNQGQTPVSPTERRKRLHETLVADGLYSKDYDTFSASFAEPDRREKLFKSLSEDGLYSKDFTTFSDSFFSDLDVKKKEVSGQGSAIPAEPVGPPLPQSGDPSQVGVEALAGQPGTMLPEVLVEGQIQSGENQFGGLLPTGYEVDAAKENERSFIEGDLSKNRYGEKWYNPGRSLDATADAVTSFYNTFVASAPKMVGNTIKFIDTMSRMSRGDAPMNPELDKFLKENLFDTSKKWEDNVSEESKGFKLEDTFSNPRKLAAAIGSVSGQLSQVLLTAGAGGGAGGVTALGAIQGTSEAMEASKAAGLNDTDAAIVSSVIAPTIAILDRLGFEAIVGSGLAKALVTKIVGSKAATGLTQNTVIRAVSAALPQLVKKGAGVAGKVAVGSAGEGLTEGLQNIASTGVKAGFDQTLGAKNKPGSGNFGTESLTAQDILEAAGTDALLGAFGGGMAGSLNAAASLAQQPAGDTEAELPIPEDGEPQRPLGQRIKGMFLEDAPVAEGGLATVRLEDGTDQPVQVLSINRLTGRAKVASSDAAGNITESTVLLSELEPVAAPEEGVPTQSAPEQSAEERLENFTQSLKENETALPQQAAPKVAASTGPISGAAQPAVAPDGTVEPAGEGLGTQVSEVVPTENQMNDSWTKEFERAKQANDLTALNTLYNKVKVVLNGLAQGKGEATVNAFQQLKKDLETYAAEIDNKTNNPSEAVTEPVAPAKKTPRKTSKKGLSALVESLPSDQIKTDEARFQNREQLDEARVQNIVENFDPNKLDPITVFEENGKYTVLSGHHRYEAMKRMGIKDIPVKVFQGTEAEAKDFARDSNTLSKQETPTERAKRYRELRAQGKSEKEIADMARQAHGSDAVKIVNMSRLDAKGKAMDAVGQFEASTDTDTKNKVQAVADWIGHVRGKHPDLSVRQENEMFDYLMGAYSSKKGAGKITSKSQFFDLANVLIDRQKNNGSFSPDSVLNFKNALGKSALEQEYDATLEAAKRDVDVANKKLADKRKDLLARSATKKDLDRILPAYEQEVQAALIELDRVKGQKARVQEANQNQTSLFDQVQTENVDAEPITQPEISRVLGQGGSADSRSETDSGGPQEAEGAADSGSPSQPGANAGRPKRKSATKTERELAKKAEDKFETFVNGLKVDTRGTLNAFGLLPALYNTSLDVVLASYKAGKRIAEAVQDAIDYINANMPAGTTFDERGFKRAVVDHYDQFERDERDAAKAALSGRIGLLEEKMFGSKTMAESDFVGKGKIVQKILGFLSIAQEKTVAKWTSLTGDAISTLALKKAVNGGKFSRALIASLGNLFQGFEIPNALRAQSEMFDGKARSRAVHDAKVIGTSLRAQLVDPTLPQSQQGEALKESLERIDRALDPEFYKDRTFDEYVALLTGQIGIREVSKLDPADLNDMYQEFQDTVGKHGELTRDDLTPSEQAVFDTTRELYDFIHDMNFAMGKVGFNTYLKHKGTYVARMYEGLELPEDMNEFAKTASTKMQMGMYQKRDDVDLWRLTNKVEDPIYMVTKRLYQTLVNKAVFDYTSYIVKEQPMLVSDAPRDGFTKLGEGYAELSNKYVLNRVVEDFKGFFFTGDFMQSAYDALKKYDGLSLRQFYKTAVTVYNPAVQMGNITGNTVFAFMAGIDPLTFNKRFWLDGRKEVLTNGPTYRYLMGRGLLKSDLTTADLKQDLVDFENAFDEAADKSRNPWEMLKSLNNNNLAKKWYSRFDDIAKVSAFQILIDQGMAPNEAVNRVSNAFQNSKRVGKLYDVSARIPFIGNPFVRFGGDLMRIAKTAVTTRPLSLVLFGLGLRQIALWAQMWSGESDEERRIRESRIGFPSIPVPESWGGNIPLSFKIKDKEVNVARFMSPLFIYSSIDEDGEVGDIANKFLPFAYESAPESTSNPNGKVAVQIAKLVKDPLFAPIIQILVDADFRGQPISDRNASAWRPSTALEPEILANQFEFLIRSYGTPYAGQVMDVYSAANGREDFFGRERTVTQTLLRFLGQRVELFGDEQYLKVVTKAKAAESYKIEDLKRKQNAILKLYQEDKISQEQAYARIGQIQKEYEPILASFLKRSQIYDQYQRLKGRN